MRNIIIILVSCVFLFFSCFSTSSQDSEEEGQNIEEESIVTEGVVKGEKNFEVPIDDWFAKIDAFCQSYDKEFFTAYYEEKKEWLLEMIDELESQGIENISPEYREEIEDFLGKSLEEAVEELPELVDDLDKLISEVESLYDEIIVKENKLKVLYHINKTDLIVFSSDSEGNFDNQEILENLQAKFTLKDGTEFDATILSKDRINQINEESEAIAFTTVIDNSGSMTDCDLYQLQSGISYFYEAIPQVFISEVIKFTDDVYVTVPFTSDKEELSENAKLKLDYRSSTSLYDGIGHGLDEINSLENENVKFPFLLVFTDGMENSSQTYLDELKEKAAQKNIPIIVAGIGLAIHELVNLQDELNAFLLYIPDSKMFNEMFELIAALVNSAIKLELEIPEGIDSEDIQSVTLSSIIGIETIQTKYDF